MNHYCKSLWVVLVSLLITCQGNSQTESFQGKYFSGSGDKEYLNLLDTARRMMEPDPEFQNLSMLYEPSWNGFVEGPTWDAWWIQNSYGTTYSVLPYLQEPYITFLQNSQDLWFNLMGDGKTLRPYNKYQWIPPDGCLCDAARPDVIISKQGDGRVDIHDWAVEFTAAGLLMQAELLLISRDKEAILRYLPKLERCADFLESRRDANTNMYLAGPAGNLLAPSFAGYKKEDGTYSNAYLAGLSITTIAALDRLIELEKMQNRTAQAEKYSSRRDVSIKGLSSLITDEGYFVKSIDPDGTRHGVYGAKKHGYFESSPNHDAIAFHVADDTQSLKIYQKIASLPGLRPHDFIIANYPGLDDMYRDDKDWLWSFGTWVNGGHWSTCEARMVLGYSRLGKYEDIRKSMKQLLTFARQFRMDNPLVDFGNQVYQPKQPVNLCYDTFGAPAAMIRGLFEYIYSAEGVKVIPHIPSSIQSLNQSFPIRLGDKQIYISLSGTGDICAVYINGKSWPCYDSCSVTLPFDRLPARAELLIVMGKSSIDLSSKIAVDTRTMESEDVSESNVEIKKLKKMILALEAAQLGNSYEAAHCRLSIECFQIIEKRKKLNLPLLPEISQKAADQSYIDTAQKVYTGFTKKINSYSNNNDPQKVKIYQLWNGIDGKN